MGGHNTQLLGAAFAAKKDPKDKDEMTQRARHEGLKPQQLSTSFVDQDGQKDNDDQTPLASKGGNQHLPVSAIQGTD